MPLTSSSWVKNFALGCGSVFLALILFETVLRTVPVLLPRGAYGSGVYSQSLGLGVHGGPFIYNKVRTVTRKPNALGFLDVEHTEAHDSGGLRVGFFGDSYVEAAQVDLAQTFFRRLPELAQETPIETLAFGVSGWGTVHAWLAEQTLGPRFELDAVVYVFVENDPGDNLLSLNRGAGSSTLKPYALLSDQPPGFELKWITDPRTASLTTRIAKWAQRNSLLAQLVMSRWTMLRSHGVHTVADPRATAMMTRAAEIPDSNSTPNTWPASYREEASEVTRRVLVKWRDDLRARGVPFYVLYVPRGSAQLNEEVSTDETWLPWLQEVTATLDIQLVDPTAALAAGERTGTAMYDDHFSPAGHEVLATVLAQALSSDLTPHGDASSPPTN